MHRHLKISPGTAIGLLALFVALGGTGYAVVVSGIPDKGGVFHACVKPNGTMRFVPNAKQCRKATKARPGEKAVAWAKTGRAGAQGAPGATGPQGSQGAPGVQGVPGNTGQTGPAGTTVILRARNGASGGGGGGGGGGGAGGNITSTTSSQPVTLTPTPATFDQIPGQDAFVYGVMTVQAPPDTECQTGGSFAGTLTVAVSLDGAPAGKATAKAGDGTVTVPVGWKTGGAANTFASGVYPFLGTGATQHHTLAASVVDDCTLTGTTHFTITFLKFEVIGAGV